MQDAPAILFTSFEPSGDDHASAVIAELKRRRPELRIFAWGGPKMEAAGATIVEHTGRDAVMGIPGLGKILEHRKINQRIAAWLDAILGVADGQLADMVRHKQVISCACPKCATQAEPASAMIASRDLSG